MSTTTWLITSSLAVNLGGFLAAAMDAHEIQEESNG